MSAADQNIRDQFIQEWERNFSVIAPAGSGKTKAIVDRVIRIASLETSLAKQLLPKLVVVTYTNKAAKEMQQRARKEIAQCKIDPVSIGFNRAFFGTIHSFCLQLLHQYGHHLGLPAQLDLLPEDDEDMWQVFIGQWKESWSEDEIGVLQYLSIFDVFSMARKLKPYESERPSSLPPPAVDLAPLETCPVNKRIENSVTKGLALAHAWQKRQGFRPLPKFTQGGNEFQKRWQQCFAPLQRWIKKEALQLANTIALEYQRYRLTRGCLTYRDQTQLAATLLQHPEAGQQIRSQNYRVILDEAQDTDADQFRVLLEVARPEKSQGEWFQNATHPPRAGSFCMVGDPQQSIYGDRADPAFYARVRQMLTQSGAEELTFHVTFRCDRSIIQTVNDHGPSLLDGENGQAEYVSLQARQDAQDGQVTRLYVESPWNEKEKKNDPELYEARILAQWIKEAGLEKLRARDWSEVSILCPRKRWFKPLVDALKGVGLDTQIQSSREKMRDSVFYSWLTALAVVMNQPRNSFEIVGVLREIYGLSDQSLADFAKGEGSQFQIQEITDKKGVVENKLNELHHLREEVLTLPLCDAVKRLSHVASQRANALPSAEVDESCKEMVLARAVQAEEEGSTFAAWTESMLRGTEDEKTETEARPHAIQLITCQKAKGLEWDAVILPFLSKNITQYSSSYPRIVRQTWGEPASLLLSNTDEEEENHNLRTQQERRRLLYVAMTRARHTLVLVDDEGLFSKSKTAFSVDLPRLREISSNELVSSLGKMLSEEPSTLQITPHPSLSHQHWEQVRQLPFIRRELPHHLAEKRWAESFEQDTSSLEKEILSTKDERATALAYGVWWHHLCETMPWQGGTKQWEKHFEKEQSDSPLPQRARVEWDCFLRSELARLLSSPDFLFHTEMPIFHPVTELRCIDGLVDLAAWNARGKKWLVVDWKTDSTTPQTARSLWNTYQPQLEAYKNALENISGFTAQVGIYSTMTGLFLKEEKV